MTSHPFKPTLEIGRVITDFTNAFSKVFAAFAGQKTRDKILSLLQPQLTPKTITDPQLIAADYERIVQEGVAYEMEEHRVGICGVAAPIRVASGEVVASVGVIVPVERSDSEQMQANAAIVKRIAAAIGDSLSQS